MGHLVVSFWPAELLIEEGLGGERASGQALDIGAVEAVDIVFGMLGPLFLSFFMRVLPPLLILSYFYVSISCMYEI